MRTDTFFQTRTAADFIRPKLYGRTPKILVVLGSVQGPLTDEIQGLAIPYTDIPNCPPTGVAGHEGKLILANEFMFARVRTHEFEKPNDVDSIVLLVRACCYLGCGTVILTNTVGCIRPDLKPGDFLLAKDHIHLLGESPLNGPHDPQLGIQFPDMSYPYDLGLTEMATKISRKLGFYNFKKGTLGYNKNCPYETCAEVRAMAAWGSDVATSSLVPEAIAAKHMGKRVFALSSIVNYAAGIGKEKLSHDDVMAKGNQMFEPFKQFMIQFLDAVLES